MEAEVSELIGAERGERAPGERLAHRNGYRPRRWDTCAGELELAIPKIRRGSYSPSFLEPRKRSEQALVSVVGEACVAGVSTRRVDQVVESLGLRISKSEVSRICEGLDEHLDALGNRPLEGAARICGSMRRSRRSVTAPGLVRKCLVLAYGVHESGYREVIGLDVGECETEAFWCGFLRSLVERGLTRVQLVVSDAHAGLKNAIAQVLGCPWRRCSVHFLRETLGHLRKDPAGHGRCAAATDLQRPRRCASTRAYRRDARAPPAAATEGRRAARRGRGPTCSPSTPSLAMIGRSCAPQIRWNG